MSFLKKINLPFISTVIILIALLVIVNSHLPAIGHDYGYHIPRMLDGHLHQKINGFEVQWYTPSFGGGLPAYPNPQDIQYSLPQALLFVVNPWNSLMISLAFYSTLGSLAFHLFLRGALQLPQNASLLGAAFILTNGFFIQHAIIGHVGFQVFPLLGCILYLIFNRRLTVLTTGILLGLLGFVIVNQSGFYIAFIFSLSLTILFPLLYLLEPGLYDWKRFGSILTLGGFCALAFSSSKLNAVYSFMRFFPREISDAYDKTYLEGLGGLALQLAGGMTVIPYSILSQKGIASLPALFQQVTGSDSHLWEMDISLSPVLLGILLSGIPAGIVKNIRRPRLSPAKWIALLLLLVGIWLVVDFSLAQGFLFDRLNSLPVVRSLHVNVRYASALIFPAAIAGAYILKKSVSRNAAFILLYAANIAFPLVYILPTRDVVDLTFNIKQPNKVYAEIEAGNRFPVSGIEAIKDIAVFNEEASNIELLFEPVFGYDLESFHPQIHIGSVFDAGDGYYNLINPAGYVFPEENNVSPFERFRIEQEEDFIRFINREQPRFEISAAQKQANAMSIISLLGAALYLWLKMIKYVTQAAADFRRDGLKSKIGNG